MNYKGICLLCTGGTGGHVMPCVALANELDKAGWQVFIFSDERGMQYLDRNSTKYTIQKVDIDSQTLSMRKRILKLSYQLPIAAISSAKFVISKKPRFVIGFGGVSTFSTLFIAILFRVPLFIQEQNAVLGRVNRFFQKYSIKIFHHFSKTLFLDNKKSVHSGNPIRIEVLNKFNSQYLEPGSWPITVLVIGGSQGASLLSEIVPLAIGMLSKKIQKRLTVFHQARINDVEKVLSYYDEIGLRAYVLPFFKDIERLMSESQIIICRAGANTLADISVIGRPAILIPLQNAKDDHQLHNAKIYAEGGAALVTEEGPSLAEEISENLRIIFKSPSKARNMALRSLEMSKPDASKDIIGIVEAFLGDKNDSNKTSS